MAEVRRILSKRERRIVAAFAEVLIPLDLDSPEMGHLIDKVDDQLHYITRDMRIAWRACLWAVDLSAFFYYGKLRTMAGMDRDLRSRYVAAWHHTRWSVKRTIKRFVESLIFMNYYALIEVEERIGFVPKYRPALPAPDFPPDNLVREFPANDIDIDADVCIIGSGAGGASAALALSEAGRSVVIVEEGQYFDARDMGHDAITMTKKLFRAGGLTNTFGWPPILVPLGRAVGGTTVINSGTCFRTPATVFRWWMDRFGLATWTPERMERYFDRVEKLIGVETARDEVQGPSGPIFARGAKALDIEVKPLKRNAPGCTGSGICPWGCPTNAKRSLQLSVIPRALRAGARLYSRCRAQRINFSRHHVTSIESQFMDPATRARGPWLRVRARAVILALGSLHTPVLLDRSGLPNPSRQRGHNLTLHPSSKVCALMEEEVCGWKGIPQGFYSDALVDEGIKLEGIFLPPAYISSSLLLTGAEHRAVMDQFRHIAAFGLFVSDTTRGRVVRGFGNHSISFYTINREDLPKYQRGITRLAEAFFAAGAIKVFPNIHTLPVVTREEGAGAIAKLKLRNKDLDLQAFHPLGTCRMGADPREAVVDPSGRVYGIDNLFVADGSIFPTSLGVNPQMTIMAAAMKIADYIDREYL